MDGAERIAMPQLGDAEKYGPARVRFHERHVRGVVHRRVGQLAGHHGVQDLQPRHAADLFRAGDSGLAPAGKEPLARCLVLRQPAGLSIAVHANPLNVKPAARRRTAALRA
ncbi:hypothetical protein D3C72_2216920 [compost metagenome]